MSVRVLVGDARAALATLAPESVDCCVTSPPYLGLRDYGVEGQIGREETLDEYVAALVEVFAGVHRVLRPHGTVFLNLGDSYAGSKKGLMADGSVVGGEKQRTNKGTMLNRRKRGDYAANAKQSSNAASLSAGEALCPPGLKPKDLMMVPARVALALQEAGWWLRSEIIWAKPNPMPESVTGRPSTAHEKIWMLSKSAQCYWDEAGSAMPIAEKTAADLENGGAWQGNGRPREAGKGTNPGQESFTQRFYRNSHRFGRTPGRNDAGKPYVPKQDGHGVRHAGFNDRWKGKVETRKRTAARGEDETKGNSEGGRNDGALSSREGKARATEATYLKGTRRLRNYEPAPVQVWVFSPAQFKDAHFATFPPELCERSLTAGCPQGGTVIDPFSGAGTTGLVADRLGYDAVLCELNPIYADLSIDRITKEAPLTVQIEKVMVQETLL